MPVSKSSAPLSENPAEPGIFVSIGSNIDKEQSVKNALSALAEQFYNFRYSSVYETEAVGFEGQNFYNMVVAFDSTLSALEVNHFLRSIETKNKRDRSQKKFSSRTLDLDLLLYYQEVINTDGLSIPRDEIEKYAFVLEPLAEIAPAVRHPVNHYSFQQLWQNFDNTGQVGHIIDFDLSEFLVRVD